MKKYKVLVTEKATKKIVLEKEEISNTLKFIYAKYRAKFQFTVQAGTVKVKRLFKKPGVQLDLIDMINSTP